MSKIRFMASVYDDMKRWGAKSERALEMALHAAENHTYGRRILVKEETKEIELAYVDYLMPFTTEILFFSRNRSFTAVKRYSHIGFHSDKDEEAHSLFVEDMQVAEGLIQ